MPTKDETTSQRTNKTISYTPIGIIHSSHNCSKQTPIQPCFAAGCTGHVEVFPEYQDGLQDLEGFSHIYLIFHFHKAEAARLVVQPFLEDINHGIFSTRAPSRPNPIGLSIVELVRREANILYLNNVDILDGSPLLDIKPYTAMFDRITTTRNGWQDHIDKNVAQERGSRRASVTSSGGFHGNS